MIYGLISAFCLLMTLPLYVGLDVYCDLSVKKILYGIKLFGLKINSGYVKAVKGYAVFNYSDKKAFAVTYRALKPKSIKGADLKKIELLRLRVVYRCADLSAEKFALISALKALDRTIRPVLSTEKPYLDYGFESSFGQGGGDFVFIQVGAALNLLVISGIVILKIIGSMISYAKNKIG